MMDAEVPSPEAPAGGLALLLETEAGLSRRLAQAEADAHRIRQAAREAAKAQAEQFQTLIDAEFEALARRIEDERATESDRIARVAEERARRLRELPDDQVDELAADAVRRLLALDAAGNPP